MIILYRRTYEREGRDNLFRYFVASPLVGKGSRGGKHGDSGHYGESAATDEEPTSRSVVRAIFAEFPFEKTKFLGLAIAVEVTHCPLEFQCRVLIVVASRVIWCFRAASGGCRFERKALGVPDFP